MANHLQACPSGVGTSDVVAGFQDIQCFEPVLDQAVEFGALAPEHYCELVAARRIHEEVQLHPLEPATSPGIESIDGVIFVGVLRDSERTQGTINALQPDTGDEVRAALRTGRVPRRTLFACLGSARFESDGRLSPAIQWAYGFRLASGYARAMFQAGLAHSSGVFRDGLGLFRELRKNQPGWVDGIAGTNGTLWDTSHWDTIGEAIVDEKVEPGDLPTVVTAVRDTACYADLMRKFHEAITERGDSS